MARFRITDNWRATTAFLVFLLFAFALFYAGLTRERLGGVLYLLAIAATGLGFWAREDVSAMGGIVGLNVLVILDIAMRIGILP